MAELKKSFESIGLKGVRTYINSGNIIFSSLKKVPELTSMIESVIDKDFGFHVHVVLRDSKNIQALNKAIPSNWNNKEMKTDVMFLWEDVDNKEVLDDLVIKPGIDDVQYIRGAIVWRVDRDKVTKSGLLRIVGTPLYKRMTIRNINTVRKLAELMAS